MAGPADVDKYLAGAAVPNELADEVTPFVAGKGTLRFTPERPIPAALVKKIVGTRVREIEAAASRKRK